MPNKETDKKEEATEQARRDAKDAFKAKQVAEDAKAEKISALQDVQKLEEMLKEEQERNEKNKKDAEEAARQKEEQQAKLEEKNKELTMAVRELQDPSLPMFIPLASLATIPSLAVDCSANVRHKQALTNPPIRSRWSTQFPEYLRPWVEGKQYPRHPHYRQAFTFQCYHKTKHLRLR
mmetsp:Transcript_5470/g.12904  ORF Transcript_5470/g.12904 Transcript_5470/m.12904 type:complete len:178 (+) Transcript_5470:185-718(+)